MSKLLAAGISVLAFLLVGCGTSDKEPGPTKTVFVQGSENTDRSSQEEAFLGAVRENVSSTTGVTDSDLLELGKNVCNALDANVDISDLLRIGTENGLPPRDIGFVIGASVGAFCPEHEQRVRNFIDDNGGNNA